jgi:RHS repeat-associated protein
VVTDAQGTARFTYTGAAAGIDVVKATIANQAGAVIPSNLVSADWVGSVTLSLAPASATQAVGTIYNASLTATDGGGQPVGNLTVTFQIATGPNAGRTAQQTTDAHGQTVYSYTSTATGTDSLAATIGLLGGSSLSSNPVTATWTSPLTFSLAPLTVSQPVGTAATFTATLLDGLGQPVPNVAVTFTVGSGPDAGTTAQATTGAGGQAVFTFTGSAPGADLVQATAGTGTGALVSNPATAVWTAIPTAVTYTGPAFGDFNDPLALSARLTAATTGQPLAGLTLSFTFGTQTLAGVTDATGTATVTFTPTMNPGAVPLSIAFAGSVGYGGSAASVLIAIHRDDTALVYSGPPAIANGQPQPVSAVLTDAQSHAPLAGKTVTFSFGTVTASATTDANGTATASLTLPATVPTGPALLQVTFAGDAGELPAATTVPVVVYQPASFVIWGGNTPPGLALGQYVNFWGSQWEGQVTGGDYSTANPSFKGYATPAATPVALCEPTARTTGSPLLDASCWTSKPGNSAPPSTLQAYIGVIVSTSIAKQGSTIYGNVAALVVVQVDPISPYGSDPGNPGFGTVAAIIQDGASLFPRVASRRPLAHSEGSSPSREDGVDKAMSVPAPAQQATPAAITAGNRRFFFYSPEMHLVAESELTTSSSPAILTEYIWFADHPVAQSDTAGTTSWTFTDHIRTPNLQTSASQGVTWRAEYEPYGAVFSLRSTDQHQPLRLPGQEVEQLGSGANGVTSRSYNIHRWYRTEFGRYSSPDPLSGTGRYTYADDNPLSRFDALGLLVEVRCELIGWQGFQESTLAAFYHHCFVRTKCPCSKSDPFDKTVEASGAPVGQKPDLHINDFDGHRGSNEDIIVQPPGSVDCSKEKCILEKAKNLMASHPGYHPSGPNSNTFAHQLIKACGMDALVPSGDPPVGWDSPWSRPR